MKTYVTEAYGVIHSGPLRLSHAGHFQGPRQSRLLPPFVFGFESDSSHTNFLPFIYFSQTAADTPGITGMPKPLDANILESAFKRAIIILRQKRNAEAVRSVRNSTIG
jgi:hypothetical protein